MRAVPSRLVPMLAVLVVPALTAAGLAAKPLSTTGRAQGAPTLELIGLNGQHRAVGRAELAKLPHVDIAASSHGVEGKYRGVPLGELLRLVDRPAGDALRGKALATAVSVEATDGYRVIFALAEVDSGFSNKVIVLADAKNGAPLDSAEGPLRVIVPDEKRPARWAKNVVRIRLVAIE